MTGFLGEYESTLDPKGRFLLPGGFKKQLPEGDNTFVVCRGTERCLWLYPSSSWKPIYEKLSQLNDFDPKVREFRRFFLGSASEVELDTAGRLLIPPTLKEYAGLQKDITLASAVNKLEVWDTTKYKQLIESYSESFSYTAKNVMVDYNVTI